MQRSLITFVLAAALAACGGKATPTSTPTPTEPVAGPSDPAKPAEPAAPTPSPEPAKPAEPEPPKADPKAELLAAETGAWDKAKPVFEKYCASCHTKDGKRAARKKLDHFDMGSYPPGGHHTATIGFTIRDVLGISGKKPTMPFDKPGTVKGDELAAIKAWTDAWEAADKGGAHPAAAGKS